MNDLRHKTCEALMYTCWVHWTTVELNKATLEQVLQGTRSPNEYNYGK